MIKFNHKHYPHGCDSNFLKMFYSIFNYHIIVPCLFYALIYLQQIKSFSIQNVELNEIQVSFNKLLKIVPINFQTLINPI